MGFCKLHLAFFKKGGTLGKVIEDENMSKIWTLTPLKTVDRRRLKSGKLCLPNLETSPNKKAALE